MMTQKTRIKKTPRRAVGSVPVGVPAAPPIPGDILLIGDSASPLERRSEKRVADAQCFFERNQKCRMAPWYDAASQTEGSFWFRLTMRRYDRAEALQRIEFRGVNILGSNGVIFL